MTIARRHWIVPKEHLTIARHFNAGLVVKYNYQSRRDDRGFQNEAIGNG